jgi:hypothetical protein
VVIIVIFATMYFQWRGNALAVPGIQQLSDWSASEPTIYSVTTPYAVVTAVRGLLVEEGVGCICNMGSMTLVLIRLASCAPHFHGHSLDPSSVGNRPILYSN